MIKQFNTQVNTLYNDSTEETRQADGFATALVILGLGTLLYFILRIPFSGPTGNFQLTLSNLVLPILILGVCVWLLLSRRLKEAIWVQIGGFWGVFLLSMLLGDFGFVVHSVIVITLSALYIGRYQIRLVTVAFAGAVLLKSLVDLFVLGFLPMRTASTVTGIVLLQIMAGLAATAFIDQIRSIKGKPGRHGDLDVIMRINQIVTTSPSPRGTLAFTADALKTEYRFKDVQIYLFDVESRELTLRADTRGTDNLLEKRSLSANALLGQTVASKEIVMSEERNGEDIEVAVPMLQKSNVIGAIKIIARPATIQTIDFSVLQTVANLLAVVLGTSRSGTSDTHFLESSSSLFLATRDISLAQSPHQLIDALRNYVTPTADHINLVSIGFGRFGEPVARVISSWDRNGLDTNLDFPDDVRELVAQKTLVVQDIARLSSEEGLLREYARHTLGVNSFMIIPLRGRDRTSGYLITGHYHTHSYTDQDVQILQALAGEIAVVLDNLSLLEELSRQTDQLILVNELSRSIVGTQDIAELGGIVTPALMRSPNVTHISLITLEKPESPHLFVFLEHGRSRPQAEMATPTEISATGSVMDQGLKAKDAFQLSHATEIAGQNSWVKDLLNHIVVVPLMARNKQVGLFNIGTSNEHSFSGGDISLFENIGAQIAVALESIKVFQSLEGSLSEATVLYSTSLAMNAAEDLSEVYETALSEFIQLSRGDQISIFLAGPDPHSAIDFVEEVARWEDNQFFQYDDPKRYSLAEAPILSQFPQSRANLYFNQVAEDQRLDEATKQDFKIRNVKSLMMLPLSTGTVWLGAVFVESEKEDAFNSELARLCRSLADQTASAVNAQLLLLRSETVVTRERVLREVTERIQRAENVDQVLEIAAEEMSSVIGLPAETLIGMSLRDSQHHTLTSADRDFIEAISSQVSLAIQNLQLLENTQQVAFQEQLISDLTAELQRSFSVNEVLETTVKTLSTVMSDYDITVRLNPEVRDIPTDIVFDDADN